MATLTRYNDFKSLKHSATSKAKKAGNANTQQLQEIKDFLTLVKKKKRNSK